MNQKGKPVQLFKIYASQSNCRDRVLSGSYMALINGTLAKGNCKTAGQCDVYITNEEFLQSRCIAALPTSGGIACWVTEVDLQASRAAKILVVLLTCL